MTRAINFVWIASIIVLLAGCTAKELELSGANGDYANDRGIVNESAEGVIWANPGGAARQLSKAEYEQLTPEEQYRVVNTALTTLYKGLPVDSFFDLSGGMTNLRVKEDMRGVFASLGYKLTQRERNPDGYYDFVKTNYTFNNTARRPMAESLAIIHELPISRDLFDRWIAYILANTILFSPAGEIDSTSVEVDVATLYNNLAKWLSADRSIRDIVYSHEVSVQNWRRFRSPEDNTREMIEIYLGLFDRDEDVPRASKACKNWYLTDDAQGYQLMVDPTSPNKEPQSVLGQTVVSCEDFYNVVAQHPLVIPRIVNVLVDHFFPDTPVEKRAALVASIVDSKPTRFQDVFAAILFSKEYLLSNNRPKSYEETLLNLAGRVQWFAQDNFFNGIMASSKTGDNINDSSNRNTVNSGKNLENMKQPNMLLKLGRWKDQPLDSFSFAVFHKSIREDLMLKSTRNSGTARGWGVELVANAKLLTSTSDYIDYLFLTAVGRKATAEEKAVFIGNKTDPANPVLGLFDDLNVTGDRLKQANIVFDYLSRLAEVYFVNAVK